MDKASHLIDRQYGSKHGVPLWLRITPASTKNNASDRCPWMLWMHGGAYCSGQHWQTRDWLTHLLSKYGIHLVSVGYRLTPVVSLEEMLGDCMDAFKWCQTNLEGALEGYGGCSMPDLAVGGDSSGGSLATLLAHRLAPFRPRVVVNVYGVTDLVIQQAKHEATPISDEEWQGDFSEARMVEIINDRDPAHAVTSIANAWNRDALPPDTDMTNSDLVAAELKKMWKVSDAEWIYNERVAAQWDIKQYIGKKELMVRIPLRLDDMDDTQKNHALRKYSIPYILRDNPDTYFPPTVILHGTGDVAVPVTESEHLAEVLKSRGVETLELYCPGMDHGWDYCFTASTSPPFRPSYAEIAV